LIQLQLEKEIKSVPVWLSAQEQLDQAVVMVLGKVASQSLHGLG